MRPKIEFQHGKLLDCFREDEVRDFTSVNVTCDAGLFYAEVIRDSRDQPNRRIARMKALEKAIAPLPRTQRIEIWNYWNSRTRPRPATSAAGTSASSTSTTASTPTPDTTTLGIT